ncbi:hypothetical protein BCR34DRAFT_581555 [Clohesyomyces aquaticus]|uniref:Uncharacterized protein n=1 Tax=Clohesyomyces aquaticus TaxID=1231657 RepID=A0A1Y1XZH7_9PLEO|nr:hypothetical protein BCR34DRAFT_581555 [Clohesyomyces aquaticus]
MSPSVHSQARCSFLQASVEIRHAIYELVIPDEVHGALRNREFHLSGCVAPGWPPPGRTNGCERHAANRDEHIWARRLDSSWGPH